MVKAVSWLRYKYIYLFDPDGLIIWPLGANCGAILFGW
jgi:hypothetical protein